MQIYKPFYGPSSVSLDSPPAALPPQRRAVPPYSVLPHGRALDSSPDRNPAHHSWAELLSLKTQMLWPLPRSLPRSLPHTHALPTGPQTSWTHLTLIPNTSQHREITPTSDPATPSGELSVFQGLRVGGIKESRAGISPSQALLSIINTTNMPATAKAPHLPRVPQTTAPAGTHPPNTPCVFFDMLQLGPQPLSPTSFFQYRPCKHPPKQKPLREKPHPHPLSKGLLGNEHALG